MTTTTTTTTTTADPTLTSGPSHDERAGQSFRSIPGSPPEFGRFDPPSGRQG